MPFARLTLIPASTPESAHGLAVDLTELIARDLGKRRELTSVLIETPSECRWTIGANGCETAAHLEVCVTAGTNSDDEKQGFLANAMLLLRNARSDLEVATYVVVKELPATDWGYDGRTQADRARQKALSAI